MKLRCSKSLHKGKTSGSKKVTSEYHHSTFTLLTIVSTEWKTVNEFVFWFLFVMLSCSQRQVLSTLFRFFLCGLKPRAKVSDACRQSKSLAGLAFHSYTNQCKLFYAHACPQLVPNINDDIIILNYSPMSH